MTIRESIDAVRCRIAEACRLSGRSPDSVTLVAVSKGQPVEKIIAALECGQRHFGENYLQEWMQKKAALLVDSPSDTVPRWHFIGHLQSNKAKDVVGEAEIIHTIDSSRLALKTNQLAGQKKVLQKVLLEIQLEKEPNKTGWNPDELIRNLEALAALPHLSWEGLTAVPPFLDPPERCRPYFIRLKSLLDECNQSGFFKRPMQELSMGMSHDFEIAVEAGATLVRIGETIFGPRK